MHQDSPASGHRKFRKKQRVASHSISSQFAICPAINPRGLMKELIKIPAPLLFSALCAHAVYAQPDFDNSGIPPSFKAYTFFGGCGTVVKFEPIDNVQPRYSGHHPDQRNVYTGGLLAGVLSTIPGVVLLAAAAVDAAEAEVAKNNESR